MNPYIHSFQNLLGELTQVQLFMLQILYRDSIRCGLCKETKDVEFANGVQADVEVIGDISLKLADGFTILLRDVLYVPSLHRNLISVFHVWTKTIMNVILDMASVPYGVIILMWVLLSSTMSFIYYPCVKKFILCVM